MIIITNLCFVVWCAGFRERDARASLHVQVPGPAPHVSIRVPHAPAPGHRGPPADRLNSGGRAVVAGVTDTHPFTAV